MSTTPTTQDPWIQLADSIMNEAIMSLGVKMLEAYQVTVFSPLGWPIISNVVDYFEEQEAQNITNAILKVIAAGIIQLTTTTEDTAYNSAVINLQNACKEGNQDAINQASTNFNSALNNLVQWDGS